MIRKYFFILIVLVGVCGLVEAQDSRFEEKRLGPGDHSLTLKVGDRERRYVVHAPKGYDGKKLVPVVIVFHGGGGTARAAMKETGWADKADQAGILAVFPEGSAPDPSQPGNFRTNPQTWNDGSGRFYAGEKNIDDVGFARALLDDLIVRCNVDQRRIYATGFSNGASMVYRLGAELSNRIAAIAPVSSTGLRVKTAKLDRPVSMVGIHGTADPRSPFDGDATNLFGGKRDKRRPPRESILQWAKLCGCSEELKTVRDQDGIKVIAYVPCKDGAEVIFHIVEGMGHTWPGGRSLLPKWLVGKTTDKLKANDVIWEFFEKHSIPERK